eukprot:ctg_4367.g818
MNTPASFKDASGAQSLAVAVVDCQPFDTALAQRTGYGASPRRLRACSPSVAGASAGAAVQCAGAGVSRPGVRRRGRGAGDGLVLVGVRVRRLDRSPQGEHSASARPRAAHRHLLRAPRRSTAADGAVWPQRPGIAGRATPHLLSFRRGEAVAAGRGQSGRQRALPVRGLLYAGRPGAVLAGTSRVWPRPAADASAAAVEPRPRAPLRGEVCRGGGIAGPPHRQRPSGVAAGAVYPGATVVCAAERDRKAKRRGACSSRGCVLDLTDAVTDDAYRLGSFT